VTDDAADTPMLYGVPGAEELHDTPTDCFEADIDPWWDADEEADTEWFIEEWTSLPARHNLPTTDWIIEQAVEWVAENGEITEYAIDAWENAAKHPGVVAAVDAWFDLWASKVGYLMADDHVRTLTVTRGPDGQPLLDGQPMYQPAATPKEGDRG